MLTLQNVSAGYGGADIIKNISLTLHPGDCLSVIGANGCGKTTLLRSIAGLLPYSGGIHLDGANAHTLRPRDRARRIAMLSQSSGLYFAYSVYDTVMMGRYARRTPASEDKTCVQHCLEAVDLWGSRNRDVTTLSGGQLQRVFLARTLAQEPDIILLDEPANHLDLRYQLELIEHLRSWAAQDRRAVVAVLHDVNLALHLGGRLLVMKDGGILAEGETATTAAPSLFAEAYGTDIAAYMRKTLKIWESMM